MDDILKYNVRTYVQKLIEKKFPSKKSEEEVLSPNRKTDTGENRVVSPPPVRSSATEEQLQARESEHEC